MRFAAAMRFTAVSRFANDRSSVRAVEEVVKSVVGTVYEKFHLLPDELLRIAQRNPDLSVASAHQPPPPPPPRATAADIAGAVCARCEPAAKGLYEWLEAKAEAASWRRLLPRVPENYNEKVVAVAEKGCSVSAIVRTERIAKMFW